MKYINIHHLSTCTICKIKYIADFYGSSLTEEFLRTTLVNFFSFLFWILIVACIFYFLIYFCKWLVCCLTDGFYQPNRDEDDVSYNAEKQRKMR